MTEPYNPLSKLNLARSIEGEILSRPLVRLGEIGRFAGAGIYALYYAGGFDAYGSLKDSLVGESPRPIYVGKAIRAGGRTGGLLQSDKATYALAGRLRKHGKSITAASNLELDDFWVRYLSVDDVWIPLGENMLIETYRPVWNKITSGFGNNPLGKGRKDQKISLWDILHPGRISGTDPNIQVATQLELVERVVAFFAGEVVPESDERDTSLDVEDAPD